MRRSTLSAVCLGVVIAALAALNASSAPNALATPEEVIADGGFESGPLVAGCTKPVSIGQWSTGPCNGIAEITTSLSRSGLRSAHIDTTTSGGRLIYQDFDNGTACYEWELSVYPVSGFHSAALFANWDRGVAGVADTATRLNFDASGTLTFSGWGEVLTLDNAIEPGSWHDFRVVADGAERRQTLFIDGTAAATVVSDTSWAPDMTLMGDFRGTGYHGNFYYDDLSLAVEPCPDGLPVVILAHGWTGTCQSLNLLEEEIEDELVYLQEYPDESTAEKNVVCFDPPDGRPDGYRYHDGVEVNAGRLQRYVNNLLARTDVGPPRGAGVDIIAHSFGGLVARYYIEKLDGASKVRSLTMLGTPNEGTVAANDILALYCLTLVKCYSDLALWDMRTFANLPGETLHDLNSGWVQPPSTYRVQIGSVKPWQRALASFFWVYLLGDNDCLVPVQSAKGPFPDGVSRVWDNISHPSKCGSPSLTDDPSDDCFADPDHVFCDIVEMLLDTPVPTIAITEPATMTTTATESSAAVATLSSTTAVVPPGGVSTSAFILDPSMASATFALTWEGAADAIDFTIERPDGSTVSPSDPGVMYSGPMAIGDDVNQDFYLIGAPPPGEWPAHVAAVNVPPEGQEFAVSLSVDSPVSLSFESSPASAVASSTLDLSASVFEDGAAVSNTQVSVTVTRPDATDALVLMTEGPPGEFTGSFTETTDCGPYKLVSTANGTASSGPFSRQAVEIVNIHAPDDGAGDPCNADDDGDGLSDEAELTIHLTDPLITDTDGDGYNDGFEVGLATDPLAPCPTIPGLHDAWPPDLDQNRWVNILDVLLMTPPVFNSASGEPHYWARADLDGDGQITILDLLMLAPPVFNSGCEPP